MQKESPPAIKRRLKKVVVQLKATYPEAHCALNHTGPEELLIATVLSAQCTDERVNKVTPELFRRFPTMKELAEAPVSEVEQLIRSTGFFRSKAKNLISLAKLLVQNHGAVVPANMDQMVALPGVGRKTANVVLGNAFGLTTGVVVDTHVFRVSHRLGLTLGKNPQQVELDLMELVPREDWVIFSHLLIFHGRQICKARRPQCERCPVNTLCPKKGVTVVKRRGKIVTP
jgi:endonuclease III